MTARNASSAADLALRLAGGVCVYGVRSSKSPASATRRGFTAARFEYGVEFPLLNRAQRSSLGPAEIERARPSALTQSRDRLRGDLPASIVRMISGQASRVESNRARVLLEGINRSSYPMAPSMWISVFSPGLRAKGLGRDSVFEKSISGMKNSSSGSSFVRMSFALRGAPCGDDPGSPTLRRDYHDKQSALGRPPHDPHARFPMRVGNVFLPRGEAVRNHGLGFIERHPVISEVGLRLFMIPVEVRHRETVVAMSYASLTS
jgi:hypothetical protein